MMSACDELMWPLSSLPGGSSRAEPQIQMGDVCLPFQSGSMNVTRWWCIFYFQKPLWLQARLQWEKETQHSACMSSLSSFLRARCWEDIPETWSWTCGCTWLPRPLSETLTETLFLPHYEQREGALQRMWIWTPGWLLTRGSVTGSGFSSTMWGCHSLICGLVVGIKREGRCQHAHTDALCILVSFPRTGSSSIIKLPINLYIWGPAIVWNTVVGIKDRRG